MHVNALVLHMLHLAQDVPVRVIALEDICDTVAVSQPHLKHTDKQQTGTHVGRAAV